MQEDFRSIELSALGFDNGFLVRFHYRVNLRRILHMMPHCVAGVVPYLFFCVKIPPHMQFFDDFTKLCELLNYCFIGETFS